MNKLAYILLAIPVTFAFLNKACMKPSKTEYYTQLQPQTSREVLSKILTNSLISATTVGLVSSFAFADPTEAVENEESYITTSSGLKYLGKLFH